MVNMKIRTHTQVPEDFYLADFKNKFEDVYF